MAEEKKLDLSALGLEQETTPAQAAEANAANANTEQEEDNTPIKIKVETPKADQEINNEVVEDRVIKDKDRDVHIEVVKSSIDPSKVPIEKPAPRLDVAGNPIKVVRPIRDSGNAGYNNDYTDIKDINSIAKNPITKKKDPVRETLNGLYDKADSGIERAKAEATRPGGRIDEAKHKYIDYKYDLLMKRAKRSKSLRKKIDMVNDIIKTDPRFDGITEYERKGYIVFKIAHDEEVGINDESFGISKQDVGPRFRNSADAAKAIDKMVAERQDTEIDDDKFVISNDEENTLPVKDPNNISKAKVKEPINEEEETNANLKVTYEKDDEVNIPVQDTSTLASNKNIEPIEQGDPESTIEDENIDDIEDSEENEEEIAERRKLVKQRTKEFVNEIDDLLGLNQYDGVLDEYKVGAPISLSTAIKHRKSPAQGLSRATWGLQFTGTTFDMTKFGGEEILQFQKDPKEFEKLNNLYTIFKIMYDHVIIPNKPKFEPWLKQISNYDIPCLMFGMYLACYSKSNYMPYECTNPKCSKIFLEKKDPIDMVIFPSDESKERFKSILNKKPVSTMLYRTKPMMINEQYSISFMTPSIWSASFEPASLSEAFKNKFSNLTSLMPYIDCIYFNDSANKTINRIMFGEIKDRNGNIDIEKTTIRKVKGLASIFKTFSTDELNRISLEIGKIAASLNEEQIAYQIPATTCPDCHTEIPASDHGPLELLFIRAQLLITRAIIPELT